MAFGLLAKEPPPQPRAPRAALVALMLLLSSVQYSSTANSTDGAGDRAALLSFKSLLNDPSKALTSWNETLDFCWWTGVTCGGGRLHAGRVTALNLGDLYLSGGVFDNVTAISVSGNKRLCGGNPELRLPYCPLHRLSGKKRSHRARKLLLAIIVPAVVIISISLLIVLFLLVTYRRRQGRTTQGSVAVPLPGELHVKVSYLELLRATEGFSAGNLVGAGSFGTVYKGMLTLNTGGDDDGIVAKSTVAVKVFDLQQHDAAKNFVAECEALRSVRHRNLAKIITSCSSIDSNGHDFKALIFEFMPNGSLERWLHPPPAADETGREVGGTSLRLSFRQRLDVAIDVACALDYLHNHGQAPIVHCDLKPSNVLLDSDMNAVVSDFGLARFLSQSRSKLSTQSSTAGVKGTIGYIAPEYGVSSQASTLGDVYSYGILLLEMFTGRRPTADAFGGDLSLRKYVEMGFPGQVMDIVDPCLLPPEELDEEANSFIVHVLGRLGVRIRSRRGVE